MIRTIFSKIPFLKCSMVSQSCLNVNFKRQFSNHLFNTPQFNKIKFDNSLLLQNRTIFNNHNIDILWEGVTGPPSAQKKRARGKRRVIRKKVSLYTGPKFKMEFNEKIGISKISKDLLDELKPKRNFKREKVYPLNRGWSGSRFGGKTLSLSKNCFQRGFWKELKTVPLELKVVTNMTGSKGRFRRFSAFVISGNGNGLVGVGRATSIRFNAALELATIRSGNRLEYFDISDNRTIFHTDYIKQHQSKIYIKPMEAYSGLIGHRVIKSICKLVGIKDMYAKLEGSVRNTQVVTMAFLNLLRRQKSPQTMADNLGLNVVEISPQYNNYPRLLAVPQDPQSATSNPINQYIDYNNYHIDGQHFYTKSTQKKIIPKTVKHQKLIEKRHKQRNFPDIVLRNQVLDFLNNKS